MNGKVVVECQAKPDTISYDVILRLASTAYIFICIHNVIVNPHLGYKTMKQGVNHTYCISGSNDDDDKDGDT